MPRADAAFLGRCEAALERLAVRPLRAAAALVTLCLVLFLPGFAGLPVTDRDEARFAQSSRQMAQTGDLVDIRFQDQPRHRKPVGIYWLQAAAIAVVAGDGPPSVVAARVPSLAAAIASVLILHRLVRGLVGARAALVAATLLAASLVLGGEARLAKTDAALLAFTLGAQAVLIGTWWRRGGSGLSGWQVAGFWLCLGGAVLIKGPVGLLVVALTAAALALCGRSARWLLPLVRGWGVALFAAVVLPWYLAISWRSGGAFWQTALVDDFLGKLAEGREGHGAPPGTYLATLALAFWPGSALLAAMLARLWRMRRHPAVQVAAAWVLPFWLVLELTPTKLIHYPLPIYPGIALAVATAWLAGPPPGAVMRGVALAVGLVGPGLLLAGGAVAVIWAGQVPAFALAGLAVAVPLWVALRKALVQGLPMTGVALLAGLAVATCGGVWPTLARLPGLWPTERALAVIAAQSPCAGPAILAFGYSEPSLVFRAPGPVAYPAPAEALRRLAAGDCAVMLVDARQRGAVDAALAAMPGLVLAASPPIQAFSLGAGRGVTLTVLTLP